ncbi:MAG: transketolase [Clostridia bacterium]|nr:transketolase [Clostridia bacterium]
MKIAEKTLNYIKSLTAQSITSAKSGHTGASLGISAIMLALFKDHYTFDVSDTDFLNRDRFVLSAGHACPVYYTLLSLFGFDVSLQDLKDLRKLGSKTPGHPEYKTTDGVEVSTGPLGQGVANAVGMAIAQSVLAERFNSVGFPIINHYTYCLAGDGCLMEGVAQEACSLAGQLNLNKLILLYDSNDVTMDGSLNISNRENVTKKFKAMGWNVIKCVKGNDYYACSRAIARAKKSTKPTIIIFKTTIGIGTNKEGTSAVHGAVLTEEELKDFNKKMGVHEKFYVSNDVRDWCMATTRAGKLAHEQWNQCLAVYATSNPELYRQFISFFDKKKIDIEKLVRNAYKWEGLSGRELNKQILNEIAEKLPQIIGGNADVSHTTGASIESASNYHSFNRRGKNIHFGVREHAMAGICNGIALYEDFIPFCATFLGFSNYMLPAIRMSAMMDINTLYFFTHDSIAIGQDGASHQPIEQIANLRSIIGLNVYRPCDANELLAGYDNYLTNGGATAMVLSRGDMPIVEGKFKEAKQGGYIIKEAEKDADVVIFASGSEVALALNVANELSKKHTVSVVSMPCIEVFEKQSYAYKNKVLQPNAKIRVAIEASNDAIWYKYIGTEGIFVGVNEYQGSGDGKEIYEKAGFAEKEIIKKITKKIGK